MLDFIFGKKRLLQALAQHEEQTGEKYELLKAGIPPLKYWLRNSKGDKWGKVVNTDGKEQWIRYRSRLFGSKSPLTFFG